MNMEDSTKAAIQSAFDWFCAGGDLTQEAEDKLSNYIQNIINIAVEPEIKALAEECRDYWTGYCVTDVDLYPRLGQWRMNGMFGKLTDMAMKAGLSIFEDQPPDPEQLVPETKVLDQENLSDAE
jgi:hypothetical protein